MALRSPLRGWPVWQLPRWLAVCVTAVIAAYAAAVAGALASDQVRPGDLRLCAAFVGCGAASVELTRRAGSGRAWHGTCTPSGTCRPRCCCRRCTRW